MISYYNDYCLILFRKDEYTAVEQSAEAFTNILFSSGTTGMMHRTRREIRKKKRGQHTTTQKRRERRKKKRQKEDHAYDYNLVISGLFYLIDKLNHSSSQMKYDELRVTKGHLYNSVSV
jgi:hypothetical protein